MARCLIFLHSNILKEKYSNILYRVILEFIDNEKLFSWKKETTLIYAFVASVSSPLFFLISQLVLIYHLIS